MEVRRGQKSRYYYGAYLLYVLLSTAFISFISRNVLHADLPTSLLLFAFTLLAEAFPIPIVPISGSVSLSFVTIFSAILSEGPVVGTLIAALGTVRPMDFGGVPIRGVLFNRIQLAVAAYLSGWVFQSVAGGKSITDGITVLAFFLASVVYCITNITLAGVYIYRFSAHKMTVSKLARQFSRTVVLNYIALMPLAYLIAAIHQKVSTYAVLLFFLPLVVARFSFQRYLDVYHMFVGTIRSLALAMEAKDRYTYGHADRVARLSVEIGKELKLGDAELEQLQYAGILHDIGKIGVRDEILNKPGRYTPDEYEEMKKHPVIGARIVGGIQSLETVARWIRHHHERYDGTGYPDGLCGDHIPLGARIIAVADAFDAMLYDRPYKAGRPLPEVIEELRRCSGTHFDPKIVNVLLRLIEDPVRLAELTRPPEWRFVEYLAALYGLRPASPYRAAVYARESDELADAVAEAAAAEERCPTD